MAIHLNGKTKLTAPVEKLFVELGGGNPNKTLTRDELADSLVKAINILAEQGHMSILEKIYLAHRADDPSLPTLEEIRTQADAEEAAEARAANEVSK